MKLTPSIDERKQQINIVLNQTNKKASLDKGLETRLARDHEVFQQIDRSFQSFIGMEDLKQIVKQIYAAKLTNERREKYALKTNKQVLHMMFLGNPGTGKTTIARQLAKVLHEFHILEKGHFIEAERADLVGEYIGQTAQKTRALVQKAMGGVLFVDEAYSLARGGTKDFGKEAIDTLVKNMEDYSETFMLILAGYPREMRQFLTLNPGLESRFPFVMQFRNYRLDELVDIAKQQFLERDYRITTAGWHIIKRDLANQSKYANFANGRYIRNLVEKSIRMHALRVMTNHLTSETDLTLITEQDLAFIE